MLMKKVLLSLMVIVGLCFATSEPMVLKFNTAFSSGTTISFALLNPQDVTIDWGDSSPIESQYPGTISSHTYSADGEYLVTITGAAERFYSSGDHQSLIEVVSWGDLNLVSLQSAFSSCVNLTSVPETLPATVTHLNQTFMGAEQFNGDISGWDVSNVTNMEQAFWGATSFNQDIGNWDVSSVANMAGVFQSATSFNQDISGWDVSSVTTMASMFSFTNLFNQDISGWDVSNVTTMASMFAKALAFNQPIGNWNVSAVTNMNSMFIAATAFNQDIRSWDVSSVTEMNAMFHSAYAFDQNIGGWDVTAVRDFGNMFDEVTLSTVNYDSLLIGWSAQQLRNYEKFSAGNSKYTAVEARQKIIENFDWTISDGGLESGTAITSVTLEKNSFISLNGLKLSLINSTPYNLSIFSANGRLLKEISGSEKTVYLNKQGLANGVYQMRVTQGTDVFTGQFILR